MTTEPTKVMTPAAGGLTYEQMIAAGWTDATLLEHGMMQPRAVNPDYNDATDDRLRLLLERVERLEEERKGISDDIRDVYAEAKAVGYDTKIMREIVRLRKMNPDDRHERDVILETYRNALGMG